MTKRRKRTKSLRRKEKKLGYKRSPNVAKENPYTLWRKRPCNKDKSYSNYLFSLLSGRLSGCLNCEYYNSLTPDFGMCPDYDARYCPSGMEDDDSR